MSSLGKLVSLVGEQVPAETVDVEILGLILIPDWNTYDLQDSMGIGVLSFRSPRDDSKADCPPW